MILTGPEIIKRVDNGDIVIDPYIKKNVNPNSYNFRLGNELKIYDDLILDPKREPRTSTIVIGDEGYVLKPSKLYLASTMEVMGSKLFVPTYAARSSIARLGMFINLSAPLGDIGFIGQWTIQLLAINPIRIYPGINIGQMMFWLPSGTIELYNGKYQASRGPTSSRLYRDFSQKTLIFENAGTPIGISANAED